MNLTESLKIAIKCIKANWLRSVLTMLGIIIGITSVIMIVGAGTGVRDYIVVEDILDALDSLKPTVVIVDSIQTVYSAECGIVPGTVNQLKYCANELIGWVKERDSVLFMTAHVTKDGIIAGPKSLEHMVDTVLSFERTKDEVRFLRAQKNRFGSFFEAK